MDQIKNVILCFIIWKLMDKIQFEEKKLFSKFTLFFFSIEFLHDKPWDKFFLIELHVKLNLIHDFLLDKPFSHWMQSDPIFFKITWKEKKIMFSRLFSSYFLQGYLMLQILKNSNTCNSFVVYMITWCMHFFLSISQLHAAWDKLTLSSICKIGDCNVHKLYFW